MEIRCGNAIWLKCFFANGKECSSKRPFLVISIDETTGLIKMLNISTVEGKERKLLMDSNEQIMKHFPPFPDPSFVKLDELYIIPYFPTLDRSLKLKAVLNEDEFLTIIDKYTNYSSKHSVTTVSFTVLDIITRNKNLV